MEKLNRILAIVPAYNEEDSIVKTVMDIQSQKDIDVMRMKNYSFLMERSGRMSINLTVVNV